MWRQNNIASRRLWSRGIDCEAGDLRTDPKDYKAAIIGPNTLGWVLSMGKESTFTINHDVTS